MRTYAQEEQTDNHIPEFGVSAITELQVNHDGKVNSANILRLNAHLPLSDAISIDAASLSTGMTSKESICNVAQTFSNIDADNVPFALTVLGVNWQMAEHHSLFAGIRNMNEDYFITDITSLFANSTWGIYPTLSINYPIANYPMASVGIHYKYETESVVAQASVYNGMGYNHFTGRENVFRVCPQTDGVYAIGEAQYRCNGSSYHVGTAMRYADNTVGAAPWVYAEQRLNDQWGLIASYSHAFGSGNECCDFAGIGAKLNFKNMEFGAFTDYIRITGSNEWASELTCKIPLNKYLYLQPSAHLIIDSNATHHAYSLRLGFDL